MKKYTKIKLIISLIALIFVALLSITLGSVRIPLSETVSIIGSKIPFFRNIIDVSGIKESYFFIVLSIRLPRIIVAGLVGATLALVGSSFQAIFKNPMADPYVMGVSSGAALGATLAIIFKINQGFLGFGAVALLAFIGALVTVALVYNLGKISGNVSTIAVLLAGIVVSSIVSAIISILMIFNHDEVARIISWTMGSFNGASYSQIKIIIIPIILGLILLMTFSKELNAFLVGEEEAQTMGVNVELIKKLVLILSSLLAALVVSVSGIIGFVGLIIPHLFRLIFGSDHKILLPASIIGGAAFLIACDTIARASLENMEIPVGIITSIFGGPFFLYLLRKRKKGV